MQLPFLHPSTNSSPEDRLAERLRGVSRMILIVVCGLFPILFIPSAYIPLSSGKTMIIVAAVALALLIYILSMLREGSLSLRFPLPIIGLWLVALATATAAAFSGDLNDSLFGDGLDSYTAAFILLLAATATAMGVFARSQAAIMKLYVVLIGGALVLSIFHVSRLIFGPEALSFGFYNSTTASPLGGWNGLAIFYGLIVLLSLTALQQLPLTRVGRYLIMGVIALSLGMLTAINFSMVWWVLAFVSGSIVIYNLARNLWQRGGGTAAEEASDPWPALLAALLVLLISAVLIVGGAKLGSAIGDRLGVSFVEVRPSAMATLGLGQIVYNEDLWFGAGPNRFTDVWRQHKDPSINQTIFWNAQFDSGYSYVFTSVIGTGLIGLLAWVVFFIALLWNGFQYVFRAVAADRFWYFIGLSSLISSLYFWGMSLVYVPPPSILILAAVTTGVFMVAYARMVPGRTYTVSVAQNRNYGFALIAIAVLVISMTGYGAYAAGRQMLGVYEFSRSVSTISPGDSLEAIEADIVSAFDLTQNDAFARQIAYYRWAEMRSILTSENPGSSEQQAFQDAASRGIQAGQLAVNLDPTDPYNHQILGQIYSLLTIAGVEGASEKAAESFGSARRLDPQNPVLPLLEAELAASQGDIASARAAAEEAIRLKQNYTEALFFLAQLDISEGNVERAMVIVNGIAQLEPQNPARRYQLGLLLASDNRLDEAIAAFEQAVALDSGYANARYFLALGYAEKGRTEDAIEQLTMVKELNEANTAVDAMIEQLRETGSLQSSLTEQEPVTERDAASGNVTDRDLESGLVTSSNPVPESTGEGAEVEE